MSRLSSNPKIFFLKTLAIVREKDIFLHPSRFFCLIQELNWHEGEKRQSLRCVWLFCDPEDCSPPGSSVHGISQTRIQEWVAVPFSKGFSWPGDWTWVSCTGRHVRYLWASREALMWERLIGDNQFHNTSAWERPRKTVTHHNGQNHQWTLIPS